MNYSKLQQRNGLVDLPQPTVQMSFVEVSPVEDEPVAEPVEDAPVIVDFTMPEDEKLEKQNGLTVFNFETKPVRTVVAENGEILFVAKDVALALGYSDSVNAIKQHCDDGVVKRHPLQTAGGMQQVRVIDESDVYALIFGSKLESSKRFKKWVTSEVLPTIRKTGKYEAPKVEPKPESSLIENIKKTTEIVDATIVLLQRLGIDGNQAVLGANKIATLATAKT